MEAKSCSNTKSSSQMAAEEADESIKRLVNVLFKQPRFWTQMAGCYDHYSALSSNDWNFNWNKLKAQYYDTSSPLLDKPLAQIVHLYYPMTPVNRNAVNRFELNSYFTGRPILVRSILKVGEALEKSELNPYDKILGVLATSIAYWLGQDSSDLAYSYHRCLIAAKLLEIAAKDNTKDVTVSILYAVTQTWLGLGIWRKNQRTAEADLAKLLEVDSLENPANYMGGDHGLTSNRTIPGVSSLTLADEAAMAQRLMKAVEIFQVLVQLESLPTFMNSVCPAMVLMTNKILSLVVSCFGHNVVSAKSWHTTFALAKMYDRKGAAILAATELLKLVPDLSMPCVKFAEDKLDELRDSKVMKMNNTGKYSLSLAKAVACYQTKQYQLGLNYLGTALEFRQVYENSDCKLLCLGEAYVVLGLYKLLDSAVELDFTMFPDTLTEMSPVGLLIKGYKLVIGVARVPNLISQGWSELNYNFQLMSTAFQVGPAALATAKDSGRMKEFRCHTADMIYFAQKMGFVSRTIQTIIPTAEVDLSCRRFDSCQLKINAMDKMMRHGCREATSVSATEESEDYKTVAEKLGIKLSVLKQLQEVPHLSWKLDKVPLPEYHYPKGISENRLNVDMSDLTVPAFLEHSLRCCCYLCTHPVILPDALNFLNLQARFAIISNNGMLSTKLLRLSKHHHNRAIFRLIFNIQKISEVNEKEVNASALFEATYSSFFSKPRIQSINTQMECASPTELRFIANSVNDSVAASNLLNQNCFARYIPIEIANSAMFQTLFCSDQPSVFNLHDFMNPLYPLDRNRQTLSLLPDEAQVVNSSNTSQRNRQRTSSVTVRSPGEGIADDYKVYLLTNE